MLTQAIQHAQTEAERAYLLYAFELGPYEIYAVDVQALHFEYVNRKAQQNIGYTLDALRNMTLLDLLPEFTQATLKEILDPLLRHEKATHVFHTVHRRADGSRYPVEVQLQLVEHQDHTVFLSIILDITERKRAAEALLESEGRFRTLAEAAPIGIFLTKPTGECIYTNRVWTAISGMSAEESLGYGWLQAIHPDDRAKAQDTWVAAASSGEDYKTDYRVVTPAGVVRWVHALATPQRDATGSIMSYVGSVEDITEHKIAEEALQEAEARLRLATRAGRIGIWDWDMTTGKIIWSRSHEEMWGMAPGSFKGTYEEFDARLHPNDREGVKQATTAALAERQIFRQEYRIVLPDGNERWIASHGQPYFDAAGNPVRMVGTVKDISGRKRVEQELRENQSFLEQTQEVGGVGSWVSGLGEDTTLWWSRQTYRIFGVEPGASINLNTFFSVVHPDDRESIQKAVQQAIATRMPYSINHRILLPDGSQRWVFERAEVVFDPHGRPTKLFGVVQDITERKEQQDKIARLSRIYAVLSGINSAIIRIREREELFRETCRIAITEGAFKMAWIGTIDATTQDGKVVAWAGGNQAYIDKIRLTARPGTPESDRISSVAVREHRPVICNDIGAEVSLGPRREELLEMGHRSAAAFPLLVGNRAVAVLTLYADEAGFFDADELRLLNELAGDIAFGLQYIEKEEALNYLAYHDALTDLPNRNLLVDRLTQAISHAWRASGRPLALLFLDLDGFKHINDSFGHAFGDALLRMVAARLQETLRSGDTVARQGGDEFIVLLTSLERPEDTGLVAVKLLKALARPFTLGERELYVTASIGASLHPDDGDDIETLLKNADTALYRVKEEGGNGFRYYARDMGTRARERMELEAALRRALERREFILYYQPKADLKTGRMIGAEALIRWQPSEGEMVLPENFIPVAEEVGLIGPIGEWVLQTACAQMREWQDTGLPPFCVSINVSARQFQHETLGKQIAETCQQVGLDPRYLEIELTESTVMRNVEESIVTLKELKALGLTLTIDDFGTGYSSLEHLKRFPFNRIKIDRSFVRDIGDDADDEAIVASMISLGQNLGLKVIAEGVETRKQADFLRTNRCDEMQGYLFSKPLSVAEFVAFLRKSKTPVSVAKKRRSGKSN